MSASANVRAANRAGCRTGSRHIEVAPVTIVYVASPVAAKAAAATPAQAKRQRIAVATQQYGSLLAQLRDKGRHHTTARAYCIKQLDTQRAHGTLNAAGYDEQVTALDAALRNW